MKISIVPNAFKIIRRALLGAFLLAGCFYHSAEGQGILAYSFEDGLQGFASNGTFMLPVTQDTIGATDGTKSLKMNLLQNATYTGALTGALDPSIIGDPPGVFSMTFDLTIDSLYPADGFVDIFVVFFGLQKGTTENGLEVSFQFDTTNRIAIGDLAPGTYPLRMEFNSAFHPLDFTNFDPRPFNDIFGVESSSNPIDLIPSGFQLTISKSTHAPWVGYVDNIRFSATDGIPGDFDGDDDVDGRDFLIWQRGGTSPPLDPALLAAWQANYGSGTGGLVAIAAVPEPATGLLLISGIVGMIATSRSTRSSR